MTTAEITKIVEIIIWPMIIIAILYLYKTELKQILSIVPSLASRVSEFRGAKFLREQNAVDNASEKFTKGNLPDDPALIPWIENVNKLLQDNIIRDDRNDFIKAIAFLQRLIMFKDAAISIYGTQYGALKDLQVSGGLPVGAFNDWYESHIQRVLAHTSATPVSFNDWFAFLRDSKLISLRSDGKYEVTADGKYFLDYATNIGLKEGVGL